MLDPKGRVVMISGANRGIGLAVAEHLADLGYALSLGARNAEGLAQRFGESALIFPYEAEDRQSPKDWVAATQARFGRIDALVNNAGVIRDSFLDDEDEDEEAMDLMYRVNVKGPVRLVRAAWSALVASGSGRVINVASLSGKRVPNPNFGYALSKHAVVALTHAVRQRGWEQGIRAASVCPGLTVTDMTSEAQKRVAPEEMSQPEDIAALAATLLALPNTAAVPEVTVNWRYEGNY